MRFGGHETFPIREGWLHKGLKLLVQEPEKLISDDAADWMGVGRNMAKSIRHWLLASGLAKTTARIKGQRSTPLEATNLGTAIWEYDKYFLDQGTWWIVHANLVNGTHHAWMWWWFFNQFGGSRFERAVCLEAAARYLSHNEKRQPNPRTLKRDVACLLQSYARNVPEEVADPEDTNQCPLIELGLISYYRGSGFYELHRGSRTIPPEILGYVLSIGGPLPEGSDHVDIELHELWKRLQGPAQVFVLSNESFYELVMNCAETSAVGSLSIVGLAGQRILRIKTRAPDEWIAAYYSRISDKADAEAV